MHQIQPSLIMAVSMNRMLSTFLNHRFFLQMLLHDTLSMHAMRAYML